MPYLSCVGPSTVEPVGVSKCMNVRRLVCCVGGPVWSFLLANLQWKTLSILYICKGITTSRWLHLGRLPLKRARKSHRGGELFPVAKMYISMCSRSWLGLGLKNQDQQGAIRVIYFAAFFKVNSFLKTRMRPIFFKTILKKCVTTFYIYYKKMKMLWHAMRRFNKKYY